MTSTDFDELSLLVVQWAHDRGIIKNSTALAQLKKTREEVDELEKALEEHNVVETADAYGDILVTLIIGAEIAGLDLITCLEEAYEVIKNRRGYLNQEGIFVKEESSGYDSDAE